MPHAGFSADAAGDVAHGGAHAGIGHGRALRPLDQDGLLGLLLGEGVLEDAVRATRVAGAARAVVTLHESDALADEDGDEDERRPQAEGGLGMVRAPTAGAGGKRGLRVHRRSPNSVFDGVWTVAGEAYG